MFERGHSPAPAMRALPICSYGCALLLLAAAGCSRCGGTTTANAAEELLPLHPAAAVVTAPLGAVARHLAALIDRASSLPGGEQLGEARRVAAAQLGFDPLAREGLISAGFDPDRAGDVAVSLQVSQQGAASRLFAQLPEADARKAQAALPGGGAPLVELLPADAPLRARLGVAPAKLLDSLRGDPDLSAVLDRLHGADAEVFASLAPGVAASLGVARGVNIGEAIDYGFDWRRKSPFDTVQLVALAEVTDRPRLLKAFGRIARTLPDLGARVERTGDDFQATYAAGRGARFGVREIDGKAVAYLLGGPLRPDELRRTPRSANPEAAALYESGGAAVRVDFGKLASALRTLPDGAYGSGPQAYVARSIVGQVIEPLRTIRLSMAAESFADRLGGTLDVELVAP